MLFYQERISSVLDHFKSSETGLSTKQVEQNLKQYGPNTIRVKTEPLWRKIIEPFMSIFIWVLLVAAAISIFKGETLDASIIVAIILITVGIFYVQKFSTERILRALQRHEQQTVQVIRNNKTVSISTEDLVPGDILILNEGEKIPADGRLVHADGLRCDESLLTGESLPISKQLLPLKNVREVYDQSNMVFQGSFVVAGEAKIVITATGNQTQFGKLAALSGNADSTSPVQQKIDRLLEHLIIVIMVVAAIAFVLSLYRGLETSEALRFVLALAVSAVPEGLPVAISVVLVLGMRRMAKYKALVRSMKAIESTGIITTIATDKTGTLTKNLLSVQHIWQPVEDPASLVQAISFAMNHNGSKAHDPLDNAMHVYALKNNGSVPQGDALVKSLPFDHAFSMSGNVWSTKDGHTISLKGAPEHIIARCSMTAQNKKEAHHQLYSLTSKGFRVIALAHINLPGAVQSLEEVPKKGLTFDGYIAVADELRPHVKSAVAEAQRAGITVRMITGDHYETAFAIGKQLGLVEHKNQVFDCRQMSKMSDKQMQKVVKDVRIFSRVIPENKHRILSILKKDNITAMTGDGVNDVPALTNAHIGIAMGSGTQIAKEAGDIVLLDNDFKSIIVAIKEGRIIFNNIRSMLFYLFATTTGMVITLLGALFLDLPLPLIAVQILWINLVTDTLLVIPLGLEPGQKDIMKRVPRKPKQPILDPFIISRMISIGLVMALTTLFTFNYFVQFTSVEYARTIAFSMLVIMQWANAFNARSETESIITRMRVVNKKFYVGFSIALFVQALAMFGPLQPVLRVIDVSFADVLWTGLLSAFVIIFTGELHKLLGKYGPVKTRLEKYHLTDESA